ncbi:hypothetical protein F2Q70_00036042 [Brassica cretica]|uniref:Uncharacterized protein n=1 Tax=Brassica cretica TaxID=69181 RepID=A0A8S9JVL9_BRACR|nr:hypothetical protein F2Q70_00036042 [Brassica cretica]
MVSGEQPKIVAKKEFGDKSEIKEFLDGDPHIDTKKLSGNAKQWNNLPSEKSGCSRSFMATVGAIVDMPNKRVSFSNINKKVFYKAVPTRS